MPEYEDTCEDSLSLDDTDVVVATHLVSSSDSFGLGDRTSRIRPAVPSIIRRSYVYIDVCNTAGAIALDLTTRKGVAGSNTGYVNNPCVGEGNKNYGFYFRDADYGIVGSNIADLVNEQAGDIGFYFDSNTSDIRGSSNIVLSAGSDAVDDGVNNDIDVEEGSPPPQTGSIMGWGRNWEGQLGIGVKYNYKSSPVQIGSDTDWLKIVGDGSHTIARKSNSTIYGWGHNSAGCLGLGDTAERLTPVQIGSDTDWADIAVLPDVTVLVKSNGELYTCGLNNHGQLGLGDSTNRSSPTRVGALTNWSKAFSAQHTPTVVVKTDGTLWGFGDSVGGELCFPPPPSESNSPIQLGSATNWVEACAGMQQGTIPFAKAMFGITSDGKLWNWGFALPKQTGFLPYLSSPTQIGSDTDWSKIRGGGDLVAAIKTDGTLHTWGFNYYGQLGQGDQTFRSSPTQIGSDTDWADAWCGSQYMIAVKTSGAMYAWGRNDVGQLGLGDVSHRSSPVQIGSDTYWDVEANGSNHSLALVL